MLHTVGAYARHVLTGRFVVVIPTRYVIIFAVRFTIDGPEIYPPIISAHAINVVYLVWPLTRDQKPRQSVGRRLAVYEIRHDVPGRRKLAARGPRTGARG